MSQPQIIRTFEAWRAPGQPMVLATVSDTIGSTYSKAGHRILIAANSDHQGLVSGGGLEGDLAERALHVDPDKLPEQLPLAEFDAVVVTSHHLATDRKYLGHLANVNARCVGILGPRARKERLLADLGEAGARCASGSRARSGSTSAPIRRSRSPFRSSPSCRRRSPGRP